MQLPLSQNRLVALALVGVVLTGGVTALLAAPGAFGAALGGDGEAGGGPAVADAPPAQNDSFTPAVQTQPDDGEDDFYEEDEHAEEDEEGEEHESGEEDEAHEEGEEGEEYEHESVRLVEVEP